MKKRAGLILAGLMVSLVVVSCGKPAIPHTIEGRADCVSCHGQNGVKPYPESHLEDKRGNDTCTNCHSVKPNTAG